MARVEVACFGEILWDVFEAGPRAAAPIARTFRRELGGAPANVAIGLARLGVRASVVGGVGRDRLGDALVRDLSAEGVSTRGVVRLPNRTGLAFVLRDTRGEPSFLFYRHETADVAIERRHVRPVMARARWVVVGTSTLMTPRLAGATRAFLTFAVQHGAQVALDLNVRPHLWSSRARMLEAVATLAPRAALVKASQADLAAIVGGGGTESDRVRGIAWLRAHAPGAVWLLTRGAQPARAIGEHGDLEVPARKVRCVDATGAGDAFLAGALAVLVAAGAVPGRPAWADPRVFRRALEVGHAMASKAVSAPGAVTGLRGLAAVRRRIHEES